MQSRPSVLPHRAAIAVALPFSNRTYAAQQVQPGLWEFKVSSEVVDSEAASKGPAFSGVEEDEDCRTEYGERKGGRIPAKMTCKEQSITAVGEVVFAGPKSWSTTMRMTTSPPGEPPTESVMRTESRWVSADCGSVKPEKD